MSFSENRPQSVMPASVVRPDGVSIEPDLRFVSNTSPALSTFRSCQRLDYRSFNSSDVKFPHCTESLGSESCDENHQTVFSRIARWDGVTRSALNEGTSVLHVPAPGKPVGSSTEQEGQLEIVDNAEAPACVDSNTQVLPKVREDAMASRNVFAPKAIKKLFGRSKERIFPPPISSMYSSTDPTHVSLRPFKGAGRFILQVVKVPCQNILKASRKNGRLTLDFVDNEESEESSSVPLQEYERRMPDLTTLDITSEGIPATANGRFNNNRTENACNGESTGEISHDTELNGEEKLGNLVCESLPIGGVTVSSRYSVETQKEELNSSSNIYSENTEFSVTEANLETSRARVSTAYGLTKNATTSSTDQRSVRELYDSGIVSPLVVF